MKIAWILILASTASTAAAAPPTKDAALATLNAWVKAQNDGDFAAYGALYDATFVGIKRTSNGEHKKYTLAKWKTDRQKMFKASQKVAAEGASVAIKGDKATVAFVQRYQSGKYADHGDKALVLRAGASGALTIVREEMLYSAPGWTADAKAEVDATALVSPITVKLRESADPDNVDNCGTVLYTLLLTDAKGKKLTQDVGGGVVMIDKAEVIDDADTSGGELFHVGQWCAGGADYYKIVKNGDSIVVRYKAEDEGDAIEPAPAPRWETQLTIKLAAGAKLK
jgi:ketosteroid isomerase-like protein